MWVPPAVVSWQWQLDAQPLDLSVAAVFDIDGINRSAQEVSAIHAHSAQAICYISVGTWEAFRSDASAFPSSLLGKPLPDFPDERWLDIRRIDLLAPLLSARMDTCVTKGFDAIEPDNVDGYQNDSGFPLTADDQLAFNRFIATQAHRRGLSVGLKNDLDQIPELLNDFDWALNEQCFQYDECSALHPFIAAHKAVFEVEYSLDAAKFCPRANALGFNALKKHLSLDAYRVPCR